MTSELKACSSCGGDGWQGAANFRCTYCGGDGAANAKDARIAALEAELAAAVRMSDAHREHAQSAVAVGRPE